MAVHGWPALPPVRAVTYQRNIRSGRPRHAPSDRSAPRGHQPLRRFAGNPIPGWRSGVLNARATPKVQQVQSRIAPEVVQVRPSTSGRVADAVRDDVLRANAATQSASPPYSGAGPGETISSSGIALRAQCRNHVIVIAISASAFGHRSAPPATSDRRRRGRQCKSSRSRAVVVLLRAATWQPRVKPWARSPANLWHPAAAPRRGGTDPG